jgi:hypothetical protein
MKKEKRSIKQLAEKLKEIREQPVPRAQIDEFNKIVNEDEQPTDKFDLLVI